MSQSGNFLHELGSLVTLFHIAKLKETNSLSICITGFRPLEIDMSIAKKYLKHLQLAVASGPNFCQQVREEVTSHKARYEVAISQYEI